MYLQQVSMEFPGGITMSSVQSFDFPLNLMFETYTTPGMFATEFQTDVSYCAANSDLDAIPLLLE